MIRRAAGIVLAMLAAGAMAVLVQPDAASATAPSPHPRPSAQLTPSTRPAPQPSPSPSPTQDDDPAWWDIAGQASKAIHDWFAGLVRSASKQVLGWVGTSLLHTPDVTVQPRVQALWTASSRIANSCYLLLVLAGGVVLLTGESVSSQASVRDIAPRLVIGFVAANTSMFFTSHALALANGLSGSLMGQGVTDASISGVIGHLTVTATGYGMFSVLLSLVAVVLAVVVLAVWLVRLMVFTLLVAGAPLALACHALPQTERIASWWWRAMLCCLLIQVVQALALITAIKIWFTRNGPLLVAPGGNRDTLDVLLVICLLYVCARVPFWLLRLLMHGRVGHSPIVRVVRYAVYALAVSRLKGAALGFRRRPRGGGSAVGGHGPRSGGPGPRPTGTHTGGRFGGQRSSTSQASRQNRRPPGRNGPSGPSGPSGPGRPGSSGRAGGGRGDPPPSGVPARPRPPSRGPGSTGAAHLPPPESEQAATTRTSVPGAVRSGTTHPPPMPAARREANQFAGRPRQPSHRPPSRPSRRDRPSTWQPRGNRRGTATQVREGR